MSVQAMVAVMNYSRSVWGEKLLLLLIANYANWPEAMQEIAEADLAFEAGRTPRHLRDHLRKLEEMGELICHRQPGRKTLFEIPQLPGEPDRREALKRAQDARKQSYDARLDRIRDEREKRATPTPPSDGMRRMSDLKREAKRRDWDGLKKRVVQHDDQEQTS